MLWLYYIFVLIAYSRHIWMGSLVGFYKSCDQYPSSNLIMLYVYWPCQYIRVKFVWTLILNNSLSIFKKITCRHLNTKLKIVFGDLSYVKFLSDVSLVSHLNETIPYLLQLLDINVGVLPGSAVEGIVKQLNPRLYTKCQNHLEDTTDNAIRKLM